eukprot:5414614-Alexandrium_andersonii.AAC.1
MGSTGSEQRETGRHLGSPTFTPPGLPRLGMQTQKWRGNPSAQGDSSARTRALSCCPTESPECVIKPRPRCAAAPSG